MRKTNKAYCTGCSTVVSARNYDSAAHRCLTCKPKDVIVVEVVEEVPVEG